MPLVPALAELVPLPSRQSNRTLRMVTTSVGWAAIVIPFVAATRVAATWPPPPSMVMDLVMVTPPKPPGSSASISPPLAVFEMAPAQVLHGAVRLHGLTSSPTPETQVRVACANAGALGNQRLSVAPIRPATTKVLRIAVTSLVPTTIYH